jgi:hypothetical protein
MSIAKRYDYQLREFIYRAFAILKDAAVSPAGSVAIAQDQPT